MPAKRYSIVKKDWYQRAPVRQLLCLVECYVLERQFLGEEHWSTHMFCEGYAVLVDTVSSCLESPWEIHISYKAP